MELLKRFWVETMDWKINQWIDGCSLVNDVNGESQKNITGRLGVILQTDGLNIMRFTI